MLLSHALIVITQQSFAYSLFIIFSPISLLIAEGNFSLQHAVIIVACIAFIYTAVFVVLLFVLCRVVDMKWLVNRYTCNYMYVTMCRCIIYYTCIIIIIAAIYGVMFIVALCCVLDLYHVPVTNLNIITCICRGINIIAVIICSSVYSYVPCPLLCS